MKMMKTETTKGLKLSSSLYPIIKTSLLLLEKRVSYWSDNGTLSEQTRSEATKQL